MKLLVVVLLGLLQLVAAKELPASIEINADEIDPEDNVDEDQFEIDFNLPKVTDPEEKARRQAALKANEALIKEENEAYSKGERTWFDAVNEFADLPEDEFEAEKTGDLAPPAYGRGLLEPTGEFWNWLPKNTVWEDNVFLDEQSRCGQGWLCVWAILRQLPSFDEA